MIALSVIFGLYVIGSLILRYFEQREARRERAELELALMALAKPDAAILHKAATDPQPASVSYVDDETMAGTNGHIELLEDE